MSTIWFSIMNSEEKDSGEPPFNPGEKYVSPLYGKPLEIGCFSIDAKRVTHFNSSQMKYLITPLKTHDLNLNLNFDLDEHHHYVTLERMHRTLYWLLKNKENSSSLHGSIPKKFDFITVRGTLKLISCTPYIKGCRYHEQWEICASKFEGTIYFSAIDTDVDIEQNENLSHRQALFQAWGYKFEQLMTSEVVNGECNIESTTFQHEEYCIVVKNVFDKYSLLYSAEIDAVIPGRHPGPGSGNTSCYTELKTSRLIESENQKYYFYRGCHHCIVKFVLCDIQIRKKKKARRALCHAALFQNEPWFCRHKLVTWWAQSFFTGIPEVLCGLRDDKGIVKKIEILPVSKMPEKAFGMWSADACLSFCKKFLDFLKRTVTEDDANVVYKFQYLGGDTIYCQKIINPTPRYRVIPKWYVERKKMKKI